MVYHLRKFNLRILHINAGNLSGGAGKGALNVHLALLELGVESKMLCQTLPEVKIPEVYFYSDNIFRRLKRFLYTQIERFHLLYLNRKSNNLFSSSLVGIDLTKHPLYKWAEIIHLHWINQGFVSLNIFDKVDKPIIWTLRDMWPFTGGCHQSFECTRYVIGCGNCPELNSKINFDLSRIVYNYKIKKAKSFQAIGISEWITELALKSKLFKDNGINCFTINNIVQVESFEHIEFFQNDLARFILNNKKLILIGAQDVSSDYKGYKYIRELFTLMDPAKYHWLSFGDYNVLADFPENQKNITHFGFVNDFNTLSKLYSLADVFLSASIAESFGKTIVEAQACGTPVVCFDFCGPKYLVQHKITGYKARPKDIEDLSTGIIWVITQDLKKNNKEEIQLFAKQFSKENNIPKYIQLYDNMLNERKLAR